MLQLWADPECCKLLKMTLFFKMRGGPSNNSKMERKRISERFYRLPREWEGVFRISTSGQNVQ